MHWGQEDVIHCLEWRSWGLVNFFPSFPRRAVYSMDTYTRPWCFWFFFSSLFFFSQVFDITIHWTSV